MMLYLDMCALKRPFDDQSQQRVRDESAAVLEVLSRVEAGTETLVWSGALTFENDQDPDPETRRVVGAWERTASVQVVISDEVERRAVEFERHGLRPLDALHLAAAESAACQVLLTCDDRFLKSAGTLGTSVRVMNPVDYVREVHDESQTQ